jgi:hypothetical protein
MGSFADHLENKLLDHVFGGGDYARPATLYIGLSTTTIADGGTNITEPSGNGYARVAVTNNATNWPAASAGVKSNGTPITFPAATGSWGTITDFFISDADTGGNILAFGALAAAQAVASGETINFAVGALDISLD